MRRITKAALGGLASCALILGSTQAAGASTTYKYTDQLGDFSAAEGPFDSTRAKLTIVENDDGTTTFSIKITGIDISAAGTEFGAHLHTGPCLDGDTGTLASPVPGGTAGPHYNALLSPEGPYATYGAIPMDLKTAENEVWFDLVPSKEDGAASDQVTVDFVPVDAEGVMSIVIHAEGAAVSPNPRLACFPLSVPQWIPEPTITG